MRIKSYFFAVSLCSLLPVMVQGADLADKKTPEPPPRAYLKPTSPIVVEISSGLLTLQFISDLGEIAVVLQEESGAVEYSQWINTSVQHQAVLAVPAGSYILTITDSDGNTMKQEIIIIP